jgi:hypothetical protein
MGSGCDREIPDELRDKWNTRHTTRDEAKLAAEHDTLQKAYDLSNATNSRLVAQIDGLQKAERETGEAYLRLRGILGAFRTPHGPTCEQVWAHTEGRARELQARVGELEAAIGALSTYVPCAVWGESVLPCLDRAPAQSVAHIEAAVLRSLRLEMDDFDPRNVPAFMSGQIKCISILDRFLERRA